MGVAQLVRRAARPAAMVAVTGLLSLGMITSGGSVAEADAGILVAPIIEGATDALLEESLPLVGTGPTGMIIVGALGLAAATSNIWVPWVLDAASTWGQGNANTTDPPGTLKPGLMPDGSHVKVLQGMQLSGLQPTPGDRTKIDIGVIIQGYTAGSFSSFHVAYTLTCRMDNAADNTDPGGNTWTTHSFWLKRSEPIPGAWTAQGVCHYSNNYGDHYGVPVSAAAGIAGDPGLPSFPNDAFYSPYGNGPANDLHWGDGTTQNFDPKSKQVTYHTTVECLKDDGTKFSVTADSTGDQKAIQVPSCGPHAHATGKVNVTADTPNALGQPVWTRPAVAPDTAHPLCDPTIAGPLCKLQILIDGKPCVEGQIECVRWAQLAKTNPERVQCMYGPYAVALKNCNVLERAYEIGGAVGTSANTDGDPNTRSNNDPLGNPQTVPDPGTDPGTAPRAAPSPANPGGFPTGGTVPDPAADNSDPCSRRAWSWNPVDFVRNPVVCSLKDAFVPKTDIQAESNKLRDDSQTKVPFAWLSTPIQGPAGGGCPNWVVNVGTFHQNVVCDSSYTAAIRGIRTPLFGIVAAAMVWPLLRGIWYACIPVLRVTPGSSK